MSRGTGDTNLASDTEDKTSGKRKTSEHPSGFFATDAAGEKPARKLRLRLIVTVKSKRRKMMSMQTSNGFVQSQNVTSLSGISQKNWCNTQMIISINLFLKKIYREAL